MVDIHHTKGWFFINMLSTIKMTLGIFAMAFLILILTGCKSTAVDSVDSTTESNQLQLTNKHIQINWIEKIEATNSIAICLKVKGHNYGRIIILHQHGITTIPEYTCE